jgi:polyhydroxyalkanoate synthesis regulator phasin
MPHWEGTLADVVEEGHATAEEARAFLESVMNRLGAELYDVQGGAQSDGADY